MSFDINKNYNITNVQHTTLSNSGGGGGAGYFAQDENNPKLKEENNSDIFEREENEIIEENEESFISLFLTFIEDIFEKIKSIIFGNKEE